MPHVGRFLEPALVERLNQLQLTARSVVEGTTAGLHRSPLKGASVEFRQHRFYVPGDEPRRLDWRVLGRTDRPYIKEYDEETNLRCAILLDRSGSMAYGGRGAAAGALRASKFDYAARLAAALGYLMLAHSESVGLGVFGMKLETWLAPHAGSGQLARAIDVLERTAPLGESDPARGMREVADRLERRGLVIVLSDFFSDPRSIRTGIARLRHDRHEVILVQVLDRDEEEFPFRRWSRFRGLEGESPQLFETALMRRTYLDNFRRHRKQLTDDCRALHAELATFRTDLPVIDAVTSLVRRRRMAG
jgi:uncharacterized protein (DUF58 family)